MSTPAATQPTNNTPARQTPKITTQVLTQIQSMMSKGSLCLPHDYAAGNALNSAWLVLQEVQNKDYKPIFENGQLTNRVTLNSVVNALHDMVVQGLNPAKKQCYFIVYGDKLVCQRSYFGDMALAQRIMPGIEFYYDTINKGDEFAIEKIRTSRGFITTIGKHAQPFPRGSELLGAYCGIVNADGEELGVDVMDMARIKKSWAQSKTYKPEGNGTHQKFEAEMALRTVIRHRCKPIFNSSSDALLLESVRRQDEDAILAQAEEEADANANVQVITLSVPASVEPEPQPEPAQSAEPAGQASLEDLEQRGF